MSISNGTRQGAILSPIFWAIYADPLLQRLRGLGLGIHVAGLYVGAVCYADDVLLIAPTRSAMQRMLYECEEFAKESNIIFSTNPVPAKSKSKCIFVVGKKMNLVKPAPLILCGQELPYVAQADHLGHVLTEKGDMDQDASVKRAKFVQSAVETTEMFGWAAPAEVVKALKIHCTSFYGSNLWDLGGTKAAQVYTSWNTAVKLAWGCPQWTRTFLMQQVLSSGQVSAKVDIMCRFSKFFHSLRMSTSKEVQVLSRLLARDIRSVTGRNIWVIHELTGLNLWTASHHRLRAALCEQEVVEVPLQDEWRIPYLSSLLSQRRVAKNLASEETVDYLTELINNLVRN